jgi:hypothetical protein
MPRNLNGMVHEFSFCIVQVFLISEVGADSFLQVVEAFEEGNCL